MTKARHPGTLQRCVCLAACVYTGAAYATAQTVAPLTPRTQVAAPGPADAQKAVRSDAEHLLDLAQQLKANVDKARKDELSMQVIREADEIEKLARSVKARIH